MAFLGILEKLLLLYCLIIIQSFLHKLQELLKLPITFTDEVLLVMMIVGKKIL